MVKTDDISKLTTNEKRNPFTVPEGYFAQLQQNILSALPDEQPVKVVPMKPRHILFRPVAAMAASFLVAVCGIAVWFHIDNQDTATTLANSSEFNEMLSDTDGAAEYLMVNTEDYYSYIVQQ